MRARNEAQIEAELYRRDLEEEIRLLKEEQEREKAEWIKSQAEAEKRYAQALEEKINVKSQPHLINISKGTWFLAISGTVELCLDLDGTLLCLKTIIRSKFNWFECDFVATGRYESRIWA